MVVTSYLGHKVALDLSVHGTRSVAIAEAHVAEEHNTKDRVPKHLVNTDLLRESTKVRDERRERER